MAGNNSVAVSGLYAEISRALTDEVAEIEENIEKAADITSKELIDNIRQDSPVKTGEYKKGWKRKKLEHSYVVHNAKKPGLTHVLEFGHASKGGTKRVAGKNHIKNNEKNAADKFEDYCTKIIEEGLRLK